MLAKPALDTRQIRKSYSPALNTWGLTLGLEWRLTHSVALVQAASAPVAPALALGLWKTRQVPNSRSPSLHQNMKPLGCTCSRDVVMVTERGSLATPNISGLVYGSCKPKERDYSKIRSGFSILA